MASNYQQLPELMDFSDNFLLLAVVLILLIITCLKLIFTKNLLTNVILMSVFSMLISLSYLLMDAPDVAMTEVALGACLSTCVWLNFIKIFNLQSQLQLSKLSPPLILVLALIATLTWAGREIVTYGSIDAPLKQHVGGYYLKNTTSDMAMPAPVAAILASYRGYDTLGETVVILIAGLAVLLILSLKLPGEHE